MMNKIGKNNINLLIITTIPETIQAFLVPFIRYFRALGWRVDGMAHKIKQNDVCVAEFDRVWEIKWSRNPLDMRNLLKAEPRVQEVVAQGNYNLVHVHTPVAAFITRYALRNRLGKPAPLVFYTAHGFHFHSAGNLLKNTIFLGLEKLAGKWTDYLITINREDADAAKKHRLLPPERIYNTPGIGLDLSYYSRDRLSKTEIDRIRRELKLAPTNSLLLCIAEFIPRKRHSDILRALQKLNRPDIHLALAGEGSLRPKLEQLAAKLGLQQQVHFLGFRSDIPQLISSSDGILLTSQQEGLPRSIMEALSLATPVIGTNIRGIKDLLADNCGLLVEVGDCNALAQAMTYIVDNPESARQMGQRGQRKIAECDINKILPIYAELYKQALTVIGTKQII